MAMPTRVFFINSNLIIGPIPTTVHFTVKILKLKSFQSNNL